MKLLRKQKFENGDTIVEVLIAIAIVGTVLTGAFAISNRSLRQIQMAQEQTEGQKLASTSVEKLNGFVADNTAEFLDNASPNPAKFCIIRTGGQYKAVASSESSPNAACVKGRYTTTIYTVKKNTFQVDVTWEGLNGLPQTAKFTYRIKSPDIP